MPRDVDVYELEDREFRSAQQTPSLTIKKSQMLAWLRGFVCRSNCTATKDHPVFPLSELPHDVLAACLRVADSASLCRLSMASVEWGRLASSNAVWRGLVERDYEREIARPVGDHLSPDPSWKLEVSPMYCGR